MQFRVVTPVASEPVTLAEARLQAKVDSDDTTHDAVLESLITAAREFAEHYTCRALAPVTLEAALDAFPSVGYIDLPMPPITSVASVKYDDASGVEQTFATSDYALSAYGTARRVHLLADSWPTTDSAAESVRIRFVAGFAALPKAVKAALLLHIEIESPLSSLSPAERQNMERARDSLLNTVKVYG